MMLENGTKYVHWSNDYSEHIHLIEKTLSLEKYKS